MDSPASPAAQTGTATFPADHEIDGFWSHDRIHAPRPLSPLAFELVTDTMAIGFTRAHREVGAPVDMFTRPVNYYLYSSMRPAADPAELADRAQRYTDLPRVLDEVGARWEREWKPWLIETVHKGRTAEYPHLTTAELVAELDRQRDHMIDQWTIHGHINFGMVAAARFIDFYNEALQPEDGTEAHQLLQGFITQTVRASLELWRLSRAVRASGPLTALFRLPTSEIVAALRSAPATPQPPDYCSFVADFETFLDVYGWRSDAVYDVAVPTWREDPAIPLDALRAYVRLADGHDPDRAFRAALARREALLGQARERLAHDPDKLATFERYYEAARHNLPLTEDHAFWIDQSGVANLRRFLLQVGDRLHAGGSVATADDVFYLSRDEIVAALVTGGDFREVAATRRAAVRAAATVEAPRTLGAMPPPAPGELDPLIDAIVNRMAGRRPPQPHEPGATVLTGHAGSPGRVTGTAKVVRSLADAAKLDDGDVLVCEMTLPPWVPLFAVAGAVVADTGGVLSHCAVVAREFGLPAVVGTQFGTKLITDGMVVTVDGDTGNVHLHR